MSENAVVRAAKAADEREILRLIRAELLTQEAADPRFTLRPDASDRYAVYFRDRLRDLDSAVFVAEEGGRLVGMLVAAVRRQETLFELRRFGYVSDLVVQPESRRGGIGRRLHERAVSWFRTLGIDVVRLHVAARSDGARAFWKSLGAAEFLTEMWIGLGPAPMAARETGAEASTGGAP